MSATKHTPGPWTARVTKYHGVPAEQQEVVVGTDETSICRLTASKGHIEHAMPDAKLMAASPELLEACESWVKYFDSLTRYDEPGDPLAAARRQVHGKRVEQTRAAIAKATRALTTEQDEPVANSEIDGFDSMEPDCRGGSTLRPALRPG